MRDKRARRVSRSNKEVVMKKRTLGRAALLVMVAVILLTGCVGGGATRTEPVRVELGAAESVRVELDMGVGVLYVHGGATDLLDGEFTYSHDSWKPVVEYEVRGSEGLLTIKQPAELGTIGSPNLKYEWDLRFSSEAPMEMKINMGVGGGDLDLGDLNLSKLRIDVGVGGADISLDGDWEADLEATIKGGVGGLKVTLPRDVGVRVEAESGLGGVGAPGFNRDGDIYTNDAYGTADVTLEIRLEVGVGGVELNLGP
jgi:hypothetical protein